MATVTCEKVFVVCIDDRDVEDLSRGMVYRVIPDEGALAKGFLRVVDDSGDDYLYPDARFVSIDVPPTLASRVAAAIQQTDAACGERSHSRDSQCHPDAP
jgi:hypothetical protein